MVATLDRGGIDYMVTGSIASSLQGEPRSTHDLDLVIALDSSDVPYLITSFPPPQFYLSESAVNEAIELRGMFNLLEAVEGDKVDFWLLTNEPFDQSRFARRYDERVFGMRLKVSSPEDTIVQKLKWVRETGGSKKAFLDALRVFEVQFGGLDIPYIEEWIDRLALRDLWQRLLAESEPIERAD